MFANSPAFSGFSTDNLDESYTFYTDTLGLAVEKIPEGLQLSFPNGHSVFIYPKPNHQPASFTVLNFPVADIDAAVDALTAKGVTMTRYDGMEQDERGIARGRSSNQGPDIAWFTDPAGNVLAVLH